MNLETILLGTAIVFCIFIIVTAFIYFTKVKTKYRWVKLFWCLEILVYLLILVWTIFGGHPTLVTQYLSMLLPLSALAYGMIVAFARLKEMKAYLELEEKLNGELEKWIKEQVKNLPNKE